MLLFLVCFRVNEPGKDPGFGQSILHESHLIFHTPPYNSHDVNIHESVGTTADPILRPTGLKVHFFHY